MLSISKNTIYSGIFFFFVLLSIFVLRPFRNTIAADIGTADLTLFLLIVVFVTYYLTRPTSKTEKDNFNSKNNWRGGF